MVGSPFSKWQKLSTSDIHPRAGGHWRSHAPASDPEQQQWDVETYKHWLEVIKKEDDNTNQSSLSGLAVSHTYTFSNLLPTDFQPAPKVYILQVIISLQPYLLLVLIQIQQLPRRPMVCECRPRL